MSSQPLTASSALLVLRRLRLEALASTEHAACRMPELSIDWRSLAAYPPARHHNIQGCCIADICSDHGHCVARRVAGSRAARFVQPPESFVANQLSR